MGSYRLTENAEADLIRIHQWGVLNYGEAQADRYYHAFFARFEHIADQPLLYPAVDDIREGYRRSVCGTDSSLLSPRWGHRRDHRHHRSAGRG